MNRIVLIHIVCAVLLSIACSLMIYFAGYTQETVDGVEVIKYNNWVVIIPCALLIIVAWAYVATYIYTHPPPTY